MVFFPYWKQEMILFSFHQQIYENYMLPKTELKSQNNKQKKTK